MCGIHLTDIRDAVETAVALAGNYFLPGSSALTSKWVSKGSQKNLNSDAGVVAQIGTAGAGAYNGNLANYGKTYDAVTGAGGGTGGGTAGEVATYTARQKAQDAMLLYAIMGGGGGGGGDAPPPPQMADIPAPPENLSYLPDLSAKALAAQGKKRGRASTLKSNQSGQESLGGNINRKTLVGL